MRYEAPSHSFSGVVVLSLSSPLKGIHRYLGYLSYALLHLVKRLSFEKPTLIVSSAGLEDFHQFAHHITPTCVSILHCNSTFTGLVVKLLYHKYRKSSFPM